MSLRDRYARVPADLRRELRRFPQLDPETTVPAGHVRLQTSAPRRDVTLLAGGTITPTGQTGGVANRARDQRVGTTGYDGADAPGVELATLVLGSRQQPARSIERDYRALSDMLVPLPSDPTSGPPIIAAYGPPPVGAGLYRCASVTWGETDWLPDATARCFIELDLVLLEESAGFDPSTLASLQREISDSGRRFERELLADLTTVGRRLG